MPEILQGGSELFRNLHLSVVLFRSRRILLISRTARAFQTASEVDECTAELARAVPVETRRGVRILIDLRLGPIRVHPALDPAFTRFRRETETGFASSAIVIESTVGRVRADRLAVPVQLPMVVVDSVEEALKFFASCASQVAC
jgi:hypothetical protein